MHKEMMEEQELPPLAKRDSDHVRDNHITSGSYRKWWQTNRKTLQTSCLIPNTRPIFALSFEHLEF
jgi:hypothetical protein